MADQIVNIKLLLAIIVALSCGQIAILSFIVRKYIGKIDNTESTIIKLKTEHCTFHKDETGMNNDG